MNIINKIININNKRKNEIKIEKLPIDKISSSPFQARREFDEQEIKKLALSIKQNGLLQPICVKLIAGENYELIAGERRIRAHKILGLDEISAIVYNFEDETSAALSLIENIQRQEINCFEQARAIKELVDRWQCDTMQAANKIGIPDDVLKSKLKLLSLSNKQEEMCINFKLSEQNILEVLRLCGEQDRSTAIEIIAKNACSLEQTRQVVAFILEKDNKPKQKIMVRDVRIFVNTINRAVKLMTDNGIPATSKKLEEENFIEYTVRIPTNSHEQYRKEYLNTSENIEKIRAEIISEIEKQVSNLQSV